MINCPHKKSFNDYAAALLLLVLIVFFIITFCDNYFTEKTMQNTSEVIYIKAEVAGIFINR